MTHINKIIETEKTHTQTDTRAQQKTPGTKTCFTHDFTQKNHGISSVAFDPLGGHGPP